MLTDDTAELYCEVFYRSQNDEKAATSGLVKNQICRTVQSSYRGIFTWLTPAAHVRLRRSQCRAVTVCLGCRYS